MSALNSVLVGAAIGCAVANFAFHRLTDRNYWKAWDRTYFQFGALLTVFLMANWLPV